MQRDWIDYLSAAGSIATAATLIYVLIKDYSTRKNITDLGVIMKQLAQQNEILRLQQKSSSAPKLVPHEKGSLYDYGKSKLVFLRNHGKEGRIGRVSCHPQHVQIKKGNTVFSENDIVTFFLTVDEDRPWSEEDYVFIRFEYFDLFSNMYATSVYVNNKGVVRIVMFETYEDAIAQELV